MVPAPVRPVRAEPRPDETRALGRLGFDELGRAIGGIGGMHRGVAERVFNSVGPAGRPVRVVHDTLSAGVYMGVRAATSAIGRGADLALAGRRAVGDGRSISTDPRGGTFLGIVEGLIGDQLERERSDLHQPMSIRLDRRAVDLDPGSLRTAFPHARPQLVVFLHGLMETETAWSIGGGPTYAERLDRDAGMTGVQVRFNTGRRVSENGRSLAELLSELVAAWPVEVEEIALVGHSMGGLVARSACFIGTEEHHRWTGLVRQTVALGTPHMGAPLEQAVHYASAGLAALPETRTMANFLRRRSGGIRDLRGGALVDEDWRDCDPEALRAAALREVPLLEGATHYFVSATVTRSPSHPLGRMFGDLLVLRPSASGYSRSRRIAFEEENGVHLGGANHFALLNHPRVYDRLREWLRPGR
jgi:pimeloyl-ACP methyl ester carboxylesterase